MLVIRESMPFFVLCLEDTCLDNNIDEHFKAVGGGNCVVSKGGEDTFFDRSLAENLKLPRGLTSASCCLGFALVLSCP